MTNKIKHFLSLLPESMKATVRKHSGMLDDATADYLEEELEKYFEQIKRNSGENKDIDLVLIEKMVEVFKALMKKFPGMDQDEKKITSVALRYFVDAEDARLDFKDPFGFDDDLAVLNAALISMGQEDLIIRR